MTLNDSVITKGFIISGVMNMSVLLFSRFFTNETIPEFDKIVMSNFGLLMIVIWGMAYSIYFNLKKISCCKMAYWRFCD